MTRHPDNPLWHQERDLPIVILTRSAWDDAAARGYVTAEHVMGRLKHIVDHVFGNEGSIGFDEDGFVTAITAEGLPLPGGVKLFVYPNDHPPPHAHIVVRSRPEMKLRVRLDTGEFMDNPPAELGKRLKGFQAAIRENHEVLAGWWNSYHGGPVVLE